MRCRTVSNRCMLTGLLLLLSFSCWAQKPSNVTEAEMAFLPAYCPDTQGFKYTQNTSPRGAYWVGLMGKGFWSMHHYCWALVHLSRAGRAGASARVRQHSLNEAVHNINFVLERTEPDFVLRPELLVKYATVLLQLSRDAEAVAAFQQAAQVKRDYWPAYSGLADYWRTKGDLQRAKVVVEEGLKYSPESKTLNTMLTELANVESRKPLQKQGTERLKPPPKEDQSLQQDAPKAD